MDEHFFARDVVAVAAELLGARLLVNGIGGLLVETEAYRQDDEASHSFRGRWLEMRRCAGRRAAGEARKLCAGPGNLCKALAITGEMNGLSVLTDPFFLEASSEVPASASGVRIGITKAAERPWRFAVAVSGERHEGGDGLCGI